jgi:hypothetical protein
MSPSNVVGQSAGAVSTGTGVDASQSIRRCPIAPDLHQPKESRKEKWKTSKDTAAGAAKPIPGKYDGLSQN